MEINETRHDMADAITVSGTCIYARLYHVGVDAAGARKLSSGKKRATSATLCFFSERVLKSAAAALAQAEVLASGSKQRDAVLWPRSDRSTA